MLKNEIREVLAAARKIGWVLEPDAKGLLAAAGLSVPAYRLCADREDALRWARDIGYPVAAKVVSPQAMHKSDVGGVAVGIDGDQALAGVFTKMSRIKGFRGILVEEMVSGVELIVGAKIDYQFGPIILLGIGGTGVEIYQDTAIRMAPLAQRDVSSMVASLKARALLEGYRGSAGVDMGALTRSILAFSDLVMALGDEFESIDLNPVMCSPEACLVADARIVLPQRRAPNRQVYK